MHGPRAFGYIMQTVWNRMGPQGSPLLANEFTDHQSRIIYVCVSVTPLFTQWVKEPYSKVMGKAERMMPNTEQLRPTVAY